MAFLKELMNLQLSCFSHDELEEMLQWYILQRGDAKETGNGMITHYFDESRHLHFFHYLETQGDSMEDGIWRVDVHYDTGRESDSIIALEKDLDAYISTEDDRFDTALPVTWKLGDKLVPVSQRTSICLLLMSTSSTLKKITMRRKKRPVCRKLERFCQQDSFIRL